MPHHNCSENSERIKISGHIEINDSECSRDEHRRRREGHHEKHHEERHEERREEHCEESHHEESHCEESHHDEHDEHGYKKRCHCQRCKRTYDEWCRKHKEEGHTTCRRKCYTICEIKCEKPIHKRLHWGYKKEYEGKWEPYHKVREPRCHKCKRERNECECKVRVNLCVRCGRGREECRCHRG